MAFVPPHDRVLEYSTSNSQTVFTVTGAADSSFNPFSASMAINDTTIGGVVEPGVAFKAGILTYSNTNEVTVSTVLESRGTFSASGIKQVFMGLPALRTLMFDGDQTFTTGQKQQARAHRNGACALRRASNLAMSSSWRRDRAMSSRPPSRRSRLIASISKCTQPPSGPRIS